LEQRLADQQFVTKAKPEVVQRARDDLSAAEARLAMLLATLGETAAGA
jgi:valyl-tRNA synthetase